ncbi:PREDICTED: LOW QUALITY PROTEIN: baculoviral IAP repeat-containing protein 6-like [Branchiostoma belcheri]|uniref:Dual E2 ubiquitin-conjugating enzyme/E3 ubiquitin-protein ligase BIRC6 n=1 Tax=Branchiostoma belcheri TaxID=7741 RepID=A0A6P4Z0B5_BRABE|nr:PREDICTED: LOW QUALITY PROTEIN: baculoviral IAP repeat-containing protein 6-like [Branchiostoma belcheri]
MAATEWFVTQEGCLTCGEGVSGVSYHPTLNTILVATKTGVEVIDVNSGAVLTKSDLGARPGSRLRCEYLPLAEKVLMSDGFAIGMRKDLNGVLLLDTALQTLVDKTEDTVKVELPLSEATQLLASLESVDMRGVDYVPEVKKELRSAVDRCQQAAPKKKNKKAKVRRKFPSQRCTFPFPDNTCKERAWACVSLELPHCALKSVYSGLVNERKRTNLGPALPIASAIVERLSSLLAAGSAEGATAGVVDRALMYSEAARRETFKNWPHMNYRWALPDAMAQAGFYHQPTSSRDDRAMCFTCSVCLVCWEPTDEPWSEHERHSPNCPFVKGEHTQNVPMSVTLATSPALSHSDCSEEICAVSSSSCPSLLATATMHGNICVWNVARQLKMALQFTVDPKQTFVTQTLSASQIQRRKVLEAWVHKPGEDKGTGPGANSDQQVASKTTPATAPGPAAGRISPSDLQIEEAGAEPPMDTNGNGPHLGHENQGAEAPSQGSEGGPEKSGEARHSQSDIMEIDLDTGASFPLITPSKLVHFHPDDIHVTALCVVQAPDDSPTPESPVPQQLNNLSDPSLDAKEKDSDKRPVSLISGLSLWKSSVVQDLNRKNAALQRRTTHEVAGKVELKAEKAASLPEEESSCLYLLVHDISGIDEENFRPRKNSGPSSSSGSKGSSLYQSLAQDFFVSQISEFEDPILLDDPIEEGTVVGEVIMETPSPVAMVASPSSPQGDVPSDGKGPSIKPGSMVQCIELPIKKEGRFRISAVLPLVDGKHIVVVVMATEAQRVARRSATNSSSKVTEDVEMKEAEEADESPKESRGAEAIDSCDVKAAQHHPEGATSSAKPGRDAASDQAEEGGKSKEVFGYLLLYELFFTQELVTVVGSPVAVHTLRAPRDVLAFVSVLPQDFLDLHGEDSESNSASEDEDDEGVTEHQPRRERKIRGLGQLAATTQDGRVCLLDAGTFQPLAEFKPQEGEKFVHVTHCSGSGQLCAATYTGKLHFLKVSHTRDRPEKVPQQGVVEVDSVPEETTVENSGLIPSQPPAPTTMDTSPPPAKGEADDLLLYQPLTAEVLSSLRELVKFRTLVPRFTATVPPCWTEVQQEQQQRRHPQHLHQQQEGDATRHTRSWRLQPDSSSWDEHLFELIVPKPCTIGHVDVKFSLCHNFSVLPKIQVTLLRQRNIAVTNTNGPALDPATRKLLTKTGRLKNKSGATSSEDVSSLEKLFHDDVEVDQPIEFELQQEGESRGTEEEDDELKPQFLDTHKTDILCGPILIESGLDLTGNSGILSLTSPALLRTKHKAFLLHIKALDPEESAGDALKPATNNTKGAAIKSILADKALSAADRLAQTAPNQKKVEKVKGCNWIQELSITIRRCKRTTIPRERTQRCLMLETPSFWEQLVCLATGEQKGAEAQKWDFPCFEHAQIVALDILAWLASVQMNQRGAKHGHVITCVQSYLPSLVKSSFLEATRSVAHKCTRLIVLCLDYAKQSGDLDQLATFNVALLHALLDCLPLTPHAASAGALHWYFTLFNHVKLMDVDAIGGTCVSLLSELSEQLNGRMLPQHALLRARFGLYGTPFEPVLFDIDQSIASKAGTGSTLDELLAMADNINNPTGKDSDSNLSEVQQLLKGMLEVEPLHFTCSSTSDGTRMEKADSAPSLPTTSGISVVAPMSGTGTTAIAGEGNSSVQSAAEAALASLQNAMASAEQQLSALQQKQQHLIKLQQQKQKLEQKLQESKMEANLGNNINPAPMFSYTTETVFPPTPKSTPLFMTPPLTPPNEPQSGGQKAISGFGTFLSSFPLPEKPPTYAQVLQQQGNKKYHHITLMKNPTLAWQGADPAPPPPPPEGRPVHAVSTHLYYHLLQPPVPQVLTIERMHSGARRFAVLDFGRQVLLTDMVIPACGDLSSLSVDVWTQGEEVDGRRLVVSTDIGTRSLVLTDLMPPPICRFLKITVIGRYGSGTTRSKIPVGQFYGHTCIFPWEREAAGSSGAEEGQGRVASVEQHLQLLVALQEDIQCRYSLACNRLDSLLNSLDLPQTTWGLASLKRGTPETKEEDVKVQQAYNDCIQLQLQSNLVHHAIARIMRASAGLPTYHIPAASNLSQQLRVSSTDKLRVLSESLLDILISLSTSPSLPDTDSAIVDFFQPDVCERLFKHLCVHGSPTLRQKAGGLLLRLCGAQGWWGDFLARGLQELFNSEQNVLFPQDRLFVLLTSLGQKSMSVSTCGGILESLLSLVSRLLAPLQQRDSAGQADSVAEELGALDLPLVSWVLLFLSRILDSTASRGNGDEEDSNGCPPRKVAREDEGNNFPSRWDFVGNEMQPPNSQSSSSRTGATKLLRRKLKKTLLHQKQEILDLQAKQKMLMSSLKGGSEPKSSYEKMQLNVFKKQMKAHADKVHFKDIMTLRRTTHPSLYRQEEEGATDSGRGSPETDLVLCQLGRKQCIPVVRGLVALLLNMDFTCHVDLFLVICKVIARISGATRPAITLSEMMSERQLEQLLLLCVGSDYNRGSISWGGPWAHHAITCLMKDVLEGERLYPMTCSPGVTLENTPDEDLMGEVEGEETPPSPPSPPSESPPSVEENSEGMDTSEAKQDLPSGSTPPTANGASATSQADKQESPGDNFDKDGAMLVDFLLVDEDEHLEEEINAELKILFPNYTPSKVKKVKGSFNMAGSPKFARRDTQLTLTALAANATESLGQKSISLAMDSRLEVGVWTRADVLLKRMESEAAESFHHVVSTPLVPAGSHQQPLTDDSLAQDMFVTPQSAISSPLVLSTCFNHLFGQLQLQRVQLDLLLQLWLTLNENGEGTSSGFDSSKVPTIPLNEGSISSLLSCLSWFPNMPVRSWCLAWNTLSLMANIRTPALQASPLDTSDIWLASSIIADGNVIPVVVRFLSGATVQGPPTPSSTNVQYGPTVTQAFQDFLVRLQLHSNMDKFQDLMLRLVYILASDRGAFQLCLGPLDTQVHFLDFILEQNFESVDTTTAMGVIESISSLVYSYIMCSESLNSRSQSDNSVSARSCFGGLFASILRPADARSLGEGNRDVLMCNLLKLVKTLVKIPLPQSRLFQMTHRTPSSVGSADAAAEGESSNSSAELIIQTNFSELNRNSTDSSKLATTQSPGLNVSASDEEKSSSGESGGASGSSPEKKPKFTSCSHVTETAGWEKKQKCLADLVLGHSNTMAYLLSALSGCNSNTMAMIIGSSGLHITMNDSFATSDPLSAGDGIFMILCALNNKATQIELVLQPILQYMSCGFSTQQGSLTMCQLSEPLLWYILRVLDCEKSIRAFNDLGGIQVICTNLVRSNRSAINTNPSLVSTIMRFLDSGKSLKTPPLARPVANTDVDNMEGLHNFAPLGSITCSSPSTQPPDVLIQAAPPHRRARSAAWSYHFIPDEVWCNLTINLPVAILLKEVHIQPHATSLATSPSAVCVEVSRDGSSFLPVSSPVSTSGLTFIKLVLQKTEIATAICLRLRRPRDSSSIGLSQILLFGLTAFGNTATTLVNNPFVPTEDAVSKSSVGWLRLLHHTLTHIQEMEGLIATAAAPTPSLMTTCVALLLSPHAGVYACNIEAVLLKIGLHSTEMGLALIDILLRNNSCLQTEHESPPSLLGRQNGISSDSTVDIVYQLGMTQDPGTEHRVQALLSWLGDTARVALRKHSCMSFRGSMATLSSVEQVLSTPSPAHIHCVAAIVWASYELPVQYNLLDILSQDFLSSIYEWSMVLELGSPLKKSVDALICAVCHVNPRYFAMLLEWMGVALNMANNSTDDNKDRNASISDDTKEAHQEMNEHFDSPMPSLPVQDFSHLVLDESHLNTLAFACQAPKAVTQLLDSGFPAMLAQGLYEFCTREIQRCLRQDEEPPVSPRRDPNTLCITTDLVAPVLNFLASVAMDNVMKDWLGGVQGNIFWPCLLSMLCNTAPPSSTAVQYSSAASPAMQRTSASSSNVLGGQHRTAIENATIAFFTAVMSCHKENQQLVSTVLCSVIRNRSEMIQSLPARGHGTHNLVISGFTRRLFLQLMLEDEKITVFIHSPCQLYKGKSNATAGIIQHPMYGAGHKFRTISAKLSSTCSEVLSLVSDAGTFLFPDTPSLTQKLLETREEKIKVDEEVGKTQKKKEGSGGAGSSAGAQGESSSAESTENGVEGVETVTLAAGQMFAKGLKSKAKRSDSKKATPPRPPTRRGRNPPPSSDKSSSSLSATMNIPVLSLYHKLLPGQPLPSDMTLSQLVVLLQERGMPQGYPSLDFTMKLSAKKVPTVKTDNSKKLKTEKDSEPEAEASQPPLDLNSFPNAFEEKEPKEPPVELIPEEVLLGTAHLPSPLLVFAGMGGLALIAEHLPLLYPEITRQVQTPCVGSGSEKLGDSDKEYPMEWVAVDQTGELTYEIPEQVTVSGSDTSKPSAPRPSARAPPAIPPHSLAAFGLFLRLPGYAEVLLKERKRAQFLLRLVLGVMDDGDGGHILSSPIATSLPTLPFSVLKQLFDSAPLTTDDGVLLRRMTLEIGALHLILACLSVLSHHEPRVQVTGLAQPETSTGQNGEKSSEKPNNGKIFPTAQEPSAPETGQEKGQLYWAKGTGFGTGSTTSGWDVEQALTRQRMEEEHVTCLLQVLASYINPGGHVPDEDGEEGGQVEMLSVQQTALPTIIPELLSHSCLIPALSSYLRNDSVLDMARHVPLYRAVLELLRALAISRHLVHLLLPLPQPQQLGAEPDGEEPPVSVSRLLEKMKQCVDTYAKTLRNNKEKKGKNTKPEDDSESEGLALLIPDIQHTAILVHKTTSQLLAQLKGSASGSSEEEKRRAMMATATPDAKYMSIMKDLQFDTYLITSEDDDGKIQFNMGFHFASNVKAAGDVSNPRRARRLAQEAVTLSTSLPLSASSSVFVRCDEDRLDIMKVLITGPSDTPYANGCFEFDVYFPQDYPNSPMLVNLETTGHHSVRFNPNLYNDGKVCLSVLNTWHGRPEEKWNSQTSSFLQVLVSIQSLILVSEPYFNEPGYERSRGTPSGMQSSREYDANIRQATVKWAMLEQLRNPSPCFKEVIQKHFWLKRVEVLAQCEEWIADIETYTSDKRVGRTMAHHAAALRRHTAQLREELMKMKPPTDLEDGAASKDAGSNDAEEITEKNNSDNTAEAAEPSTDEQSKDVTDGQHASVSLGGKISLDVEGQSGNSTDGQSNTSTDGQTSSSADEHTSTSTEEQTNGSSDNQTAVVTGAQTA